MTAIDFFLQVSFPPACRILQPQRRGHLCLVGLQLTQGKAELLFLVSNFLCLPKLADTALNCKAQLPPDTVLALAPALQPSLWERVSPAL